MVLVKWTNHKEDIDAYLNGGSSEEGSNTSAASESTSSDVVNASATQALPEGDFLKLQKNTCNAQSNC